MAKKQQNTVALGSALVDLFAGLGDGQERTPPTAFRLFHFGVNHSDQGDFVLDQPACEAVMSEWAKQRRDLVIDYEHQSLTGQRAPAAGWFVPEVRADGLWASNVRWTPDAAKHLSQGEYRYFSPTFDYDRKTGQVTLLRNAALTNNPSLYAIPALVAASSRPNEEDTDMDELAKANARIAELTAQLSQRDEEMRVVRGQTATAHLSTTIGLSPTAKPEELQAALGQLASLRSKILEATGKETLPAALGVIDTWKSEAADAGRLKAEKEELETAACASAMKDILDKAVEQRKVPPARRDYYQGKALSLFGGKPTRDGVEWMKAAVDDLPVIATGMPAAGGTGAAAGGGTVAVPPAGSSTAALSQKANRWAQLSGTDVDKYAKWVGEQVATGKLQ